MRKLVLAAIAAFTMMMMPSPTWALCVCQCSNGHLLPICDNPLTLPPICPATPCAMVPVMTPIQTPYQAPYLAPAPRNCRPIQVCDPYGICRMQQLCQ